MSALPRLIVGNRNYSSWSLRPWLFLRQFGLAFATEVIALDTADFRRQVAAVSPTLRVPVLLDGDTSVWDSLAICLYASERWPGLVAWPVDPSARAMAMAVTAEMHSGFAALRTHCPMNIRRSVVGYALPALALADVDRVLAIWREARGRFGSGGDFLFGGFSLADAFYAPVVTRLLTYGLPLAGVERAYVEAVMALPAMREWCSAARAESWTIAAADQVGH